MFQAFDAILGVDMGGPNIRAGVAQLNLKSERDLLKAKIWKLSLWRHGDEEASNGSRSSGLLMRE
jgi:hypothetical protein